MPHLPSLLCLVTADEIQRFLPEPLWSGLQALADDLKVQDPRTLQPRDLPELLARHAPVAILAAWNTPPLPFPLPPSVRYVCYLCGSVRRLVTRQHLERGLLVTNWGGSISRCIAEAALAHLLACLRQMPAHTLALHVDRTWQRAGFEGASLFGRRVGLHGFGRIARELVALLRPFGCRLSAYAPDVDESLGVTAVDSLTTLFSTNDVVVELAPLIPATRGSITEDLLRRLPAGGVFINVGRGAVVDEAALARVAREGRLQVGLDVFADEPLPADSPLLGLRNVSLTPHVAGPTPDRQRDAGAFALANLQAFAEGRTLEAVITPGLYDAIT